MGFRDGAFATVWEITNRGENFSKVRLSTSRRDKKNDGEYITDFSGFVSLIGKANEKVDDIEDVLGDGGENARCRIKIGACDVSNRYDKEEKREYVNFTIFDFDIIDANGNISGGSSGNAVSGGGKSSKKAPTRKTSKAKQTQDEAEDVDTDDDGGGNGDDLPF